MTRMIALAVIAACVTGLPADEPRLANATRIFTLSQPAHTWNKYHAFTMRLSPSGEHMLYTRVDQPSPEEIRALIKQLGDKEYKRREEAT